MNNLGSTEKPTKKINYGNEALYGGIISIILGFSFFGILVIIFTISWGIKALRQDNLHKTQAIIGIALASIAVIAGGIFGVSGIWGIITKPFFQGVIN